MSTFGSRRLILASMLVAGALLLTACAGTGSRSVGPASYAASLWPQRPVVKLAFDVAADLRSAIGRESIMFTPDLRTCELVFRAWPNSPTMSNSGSSLTVTATRVDGRPATSQMIPAGAPAGAPGTLIEVPLPRCLEPGQSVQAELDFRLTLGEDADERVGVNPETETAWFGTGFPLLAWVRGTGWARDPAVPMNGETVVSEDFMLADLSVTALRDYRVIGTGTATGTTEGSAAGTTTHRFSAPAVRDVAVAVGSFDVLDRDASGVRLHLATPRSGTKADPQDWAEQIDSAITALTEVLGPFPYSELWVTITPGQSDGSEFPGALQFGDVKRSQLPALVAHEVAHQWFYALVGNNQAEHPWLDESLATFGESIASGDGSDYQYDDISRRVVDLMGQPMTYWADHGGFRRYTEGVYYQGAAVLRHARDEIGAEQFDPALRSYVTSNAHRAAAPADFAQAFADTPRVLEATRSGRRAGQPSSMIARPPERGPLAARKSLQMGTGAATLRAIGARRRTSTYRYRWPGSLRRPYDPLRIREPVMTRYLTWAELRAVTDCP